MMLAVLVDDSCFFVLFCFVSASLLQCFEMLEGDGSLINLRGRRCRDFSTCVNESSRV